MENHVKDEQIKNQAETIASLERKIESLERELQRYLDPDSGEIRPSWKPGQKHGEAALLDQIASLEQQLADCLESVELPRYESVRSRIYHSIHGLFLPIREWSESTKKSEHNFVPWWYFRSFLFDTDLFDNHWTSSDFRNGVDMLNEIVHIVDGDQPAKDLEHLEKYEFGYRLFDYNPNTDQSKYRGMQALISALLLVRQNQDHPRIKNTIGEDDINDMLVILKAVSFYQRLWIDAKPEEKKDQG